jgi:hypothetical protein
MRQERLLDAVQLGTLVALLVGVLLVVWELRQTRDIARIQIAAAGSEQYSQRVQAMMGEESAAALARACDTPRELTTEDLIVLEHLHTELLNNLRSAYAIERLADDMAVFDWRAWKGNFRRIFATEFGRWWFASLASVEPEIRAAADAFLAESGTPDCRAHFDDYRRTVGMTPLADGS